MTQAHFQTTNDLFHGYREDILQGTPPVRYRCGEGELGRIDIGPERVTLFGGAPAAGKTAFVQQLIVDALRWSPDLKALVCNVEMPPSVLLDRQLARLSGLDLTLIRDRQLGGEHADQLERGLNELENLGDRLAFLRSPFNLENVAATLDQFNAGVVVLDYIQRIGVGSQHSDKRTSVDATMNCLREFADAGLAVVVVAALSRSKDSRGRAAYGDAVNLASFRESSELEYGCDDGYILVPAEAEPGGSPNPRVILPHLKSRHGEAADITLDFDRSHQQFTPVVAPGRAPATPSRRRPAGSGPARTLQMVHAEAWRIASLCHKTRFSLSFSRFPP